MKALFSDQSITTFIKRSRNVRLFFIQHTKMIISSIDHARGVDHKFTVFSSYKNMFTDIFHADEIFS